MRIFFAMPGNEQLAGDLARLTGGKVGEIEVRSFPDDESYVRILSNVKGCDAFLVCTLARPDPQFLALSFAAETINNLGAARVQLIAPYLPYMRQDRIFHPGEALTSRLFAEMLQMHFEGLITIDPHLHRHASLDEVYDIPSVAAHATPLFMKWIEDHVASPLLIGPDQESGQWVEAIASALHAPWCVMHKERSGDRDIRMEAPDLSRHSDRTPILIDDILSSGTSLRSAIRAIAKQGLSRPYCLVVHALCDARTARAINDCSAGLLTTNSVANPSAAFDVAPLIVEALRSVGASGNIQSA